MSYDVTGDTFGIALSVRELPPEDRRLVLELVDLMSAAPDDTRRQAQTMIRETLTVEPYARERCVETVDATIRYLQRHAATTRHV
jgi:hypothetical protein